MHDPQTSHLEAVYRRNLSSAPGKGILFTRNNHLMLEAYNDADWAGSNEDRRSTSGLEKGIR